jgi:hypothetical protein
MMGNKAPPSQDFGKTSKLLKLADPSQAAISGAYYLQEEHPALDFGGAEAGSVVNTPGGYWEFLGRDNHRASFQLFGGDVRMRIMHINPADITQTKGIIYGSNTGSTTLFPYPTGTYGGGTGPHTHVEMSRNLPYNGGYTRQYVHPNTLMPGSQLNYPMNYYDENKDYMGTINYNRNFP